MIRLISTVAVAALFIGSTPKSAHCVSGIGTCWMPARKNIIIINHVENDKMIQADSLKPEGLEPSLHSPALNSYGTHVAFVKTVGPDENRTSHISVMRIDGINGDKVLTETGNSTALVDWPRGDWVYYNKDNDRKELWRVNVHDGTDEKVVTFKVSNVRTWKMSADAKRILLYFAKTEYTCNGRFLYDLPGDGTVKCDLFEDSGHRLGGGCTITLSPSGKYFGHTSNSGHSQHNITSVTYEPAHALAQEHNISSAEWNAWSVDSEFKCSGWSSSDMMSVGSGILGGASGLGNSFSVNSDKWVCLMIGWPPRGRFKNNGNNNVIINWKDKKSMNVSRIPPCTSDKYPNPCAKKDAPCLYVRQVDFWVKAPAEDVLEWMRDDIKEENRRAYGIVGLDEGVGINRYGNTQNTNKATISFAYQNGNLTMRKSQSGFSSIQIYDCAGRKIYAAVQNFSELNVPLPNANKAIVAHIKIGGQIFMKRIILLH